MLPFGLARASTEGLPPGETDPRTASFHDDRPEVQALFEAALEARLPRGRELKPYEPQRLNERHLAMVMMRAGGVKQRTVAQAFGATDSNVSIVLNHPDAEYILSRLQSMRATQPTDIEQRLAALADPAVTALEDAFTAEDPQDLKNAMRRAPLAFKVLELNGHGKKRVEHEHKHQHEHRLEASPQQMADLASALRESRQIEDVEIVVLDSSEEAQRALSPGGELPDSQPRELSSQDDAGAPSIGGSQEATSSEGETLPDEEEAA